MSKSILEITKNKTTYSVVMDVVSNKKNNENESLFISNEVDLDGVNYFFYNDLSDTKIANSIGFWYTIFLNYKFDYTKDFNYKFVINDMEYVVSFSLERGIETYAVKDDDRNSSAENAIVVDDIDFDNFSKIKVIQTEYQKSTNRKKKIKKIVTIHLLLYLVLGSAVSIYYLYSASVFESKSTEFYDLSIDINEVNNQISETYSNQIERNTLSQDIHIERLLLLSLNHINILQADINLQTEAIEVEIHFDDIKKALRVAKKNNFNLIIERDFVKNKAKVSWQVNRAD